MSFCGTCHGGFSQGSQDQHAANAGPINPHELAELERYERDPRFYSALQQYQQINSQYRTPFLGGSSKDGSRVYQDGRYAQRVAAGQVRLGGQPYDPTKYMFTHEAVEGVLIRKFGLSYPVAHKLATAAERLAVEHDGINWAQHTAAMRPEIHLAEKESGSGTPPDLLVDPYKGTRYDRKVEENERANLSALSNSVPLNQGAGNSSSGNMPASSLGVGAAGGGGYAASDTGSDNRGTQQSGGDWPPGKPDKGQGVRKFFLIRHGKTALNASNESDDKIRGWKDVPLDATGKKEAVRLGDSLKDSGINFIAHSNMKRSKDTAEEIAKTTGAKVVSWPPARPWNVGVFTGESSGKVHPELRRMAEKNPDEQIPEGESFTQFKCRVFAGLGELLEKSDGEHLALVTHHRVERLIHAWMAAGQPTDMAIDYQTMFKHGEAPANADIIALDPERVRRAAESACAELNKQGFQKYTHKASGYHEGFGPPTPEHPEGSHCGVCRYFKGKDKCMIVVPPIGADDGCALFMPKGTKTGDGGDADRDEAVGGYDGSIADQAMADVAQNRTPHQILQSTLDPQVQNLGQNIGMSVGPAEMRYPMAPRSRWYGEGTFEQAGGKMTTMTPDEFLAQARPMKMDDLTRENVDDLKNHIQGGGELDPLTLYEGGKEDGRHRAIAAKELGIKQVPVINYRKGGGYSEGDMKVHNGKFGSTNWDEREGPGGGGVTGAPPRADGASHMYSGIAGGYHGGGHARLAPENKIQPQSGGYGAQSFKPNYSVGAGGPPKAPKMAQAVQQHSHYLAKGGLMHALKAGHIDKGTHDKAMASIDGALSKLKASKPKLGSAPKPKAPRAAPGGGSTGAPRRMGSMGSPPLLASPLPDFMASGGNGNGGNPMGMMPWQK